MNTLVASYGNYGQIGPLFIMSLTVVIVGAVIVLVCQPKPTKPAPPAPEPAPAPEPQPQPELASETNPDDTAETGDDQEDEDIANF